MRCVWEHNGNDKIMLEKHIKARNVRYKFEVLNP